MLLAPLLSEIRLAGPTTSAVLLGLKLAALVSGLESTHTPFIALPTCTAWLAALSPMRLPMMKFGRNTAPAATWMPLPELPLMTLPGPIMLPKVLPTRLTPLPALGMAMLPVRSVPIMLPLTKTAARFWLKISMPSPPLPEMTLLLICTGCSEASAVANWLWKALIVDASTGCTGNCAYRLDRKPELVSG